MTSSAFRTKRSSGDSTLCPYAIRTAMLADMLEEHVSEKGSATDLWLLTSEYFP
jgi:hypothetical protein